MDLARNQRFSAAPDVLGASDAPEGVEAVRTAMLERLWELQALRTDRVAEVFATVDRHAFAPGVPLDEVYAATTAVKTKWDEHGHAISSISAPQIQAFMLEQADIRPGMRVLEVGSGGVNAAMLAELVGETGSVTTMDIDPEITDRARGLLDAAGYAQVRVECGDAEHGLPGPGLFDVILVTVGCWDIPPTWITQLVDGGRLVLPLRMRGITRSLALDRDDDRLVSRSAEVCGFVKIQGHGAHQERMLLLHEDQIALRFDDDTYPAEPHRLDGVLASERADAWSGVTVGGVEPFDSLPLWLATVLPGFCLLTVASDYDQAVDRGPALVDEGGKWFPSASVDSTGDSFAYLVSRRVGQGVFEFGAHAFGPHARAVAEEMAEQIRVWGRDYHHGPAPIVAARSRTASDQDAAVLGGTALDGPPAAEAVIDKRHTRVSISWPNPAP
ncbi:methyltransferase, FxLD system [Saccharopolyspora cebuensis]|uniref:methyltransferase, FxLD system n=1 Tax=Saccharopolyspora cebuensis TaxID=418759 RepID=UPI0031E59C3B